MKNINGYNVFDFEVPVKIESFNTNNAWGFGGGRGLKYIFNKKLFVKIGLAGTRHRGEFPYITINHKDDPEYPDFSNKIFDETDTKVNREKVKEIIQKMLKKKS